MSQFFLVPFFPQKFIRFDFLENLENSVSWNAGDGIQNSEQCKNIFNREKTKHMKTQTTLPSNLHKNYLSLDDAMLKLKSQLGNATQ